MKKFSTILLACACVASVHAQHEVVISLWHHLLLHEG